MYVWVKSCQLWHKPNKWAQLCITKMSCYKKIKDVHVDRQGSCETQVKGLLTELTELLKWWIHMIFFPSYPPHQYLLFQIRISEESLSKAEGTWHQPYHDFIGKNRKMETVLCHTVITSLKSNSHLFIATLRVYKASKAHLWKRKNCLLLLCFIILRKILQPVQLFWGITQ